MKHFGINLLLLFILVSQFVLAQNFPSYEEAVDELTFSYLIINFRCGSDKEFNLAKKPKGWFIQVINRQNKELISETLFWSKKQGYVKLYGYTKWAYDIIIIKTFPTLYYMD